MIFFLFVTYGFQPLVEILGCVQCACVEQLWYSLLLILLAPGAAAVCVCSVTIKKAKQYLYIFIYIYIYYIPIVINYPQAHTPAICQKVAQFLIYSQYTVFFLLYHIQFETILSSSLPMFFQSKHVHCRFGLKLFAFG